MSRDRDPRDPRGPRGGGGSAGFSRGRNEGFGGGRDDRRGDTRGSDARPPRTEGGSAGFSRGRGEARGFEGGRGGSAGPRPGDPGERVVYGAGPVFELVARKPRSVKAVWVDPQRAGRTTTDRVAQIVTSAREAGITVEDRDRQTLDRVAGEGALHQGVLAWLGEFKYADVLDLVQPGDEPPLIIALDGVEDPRNLGAILRSAYLLGARGVIIPDHRAAQVTAVTAKASAGASELLPVAMVGNLVRALDELREHGLWRVAVHATEQAQNIDQIDGTMPLCLVLGAEGTGVRPLVAKSCDFHAVIPMARNEVGSFNVSVAAALAMYEIRRQRTRTS